MKFDLKISKIRNVKTPCYSSEDAVGLDFFVPDDIEKIIIYPGKSVIIPSGIKVRLPKNIAMLGINKSSIGSKGLILGACLIDPDYQGEILINLINVSNEIKEIISGQKICQFIFFRYNKANIEIVEENVLFEKRTKRGEGGFGSTGDK